MPTKTAVTKQTPRSVEGWKKVKRHEITLNSGFEVEIEVPNLPLLIKTGYFPNDLLDTAVSVMQGQKITPEMITQQADFFHKLVAVTVKDPEVEEAQVSDLPYEDIELICEIATRNRDVDALGRQIAGLHNSREWVNFRRIQSGLAALEDE